MTKFLDFPVHSSNVTKIFVFPFHRLHLLKEFLAADIIIFQLRSDSLAEIVSIKVLAKHLHRSRVGYSAI